MQNLITVLSGFSFLIGFITVLIGTIWFYIETLKESVGWFFACLVFPIASFAFLVSHPERAFNPTALNLFGIIFLMLGYFGMKSF